MDLVEVAMELNAIRYELRTELVDIKARLAQLFGHERLQDVMYESIVNLQARMENVEAAFDFEQAPVQDELYDNDDDESEDDGYNDSEEEDDYETTNNESMGEEANDEDIDYIIID